MLCGVAFWAVQQIIGRGFYANENTLTPVLTGSLATALTLPAYFGLARAFGPYGVAGAGVISLGLYTALLLWRWQKHYRAEALRGLGGRALQLAGMGLPCACLAWMICNLIKNALSDHPLTGAFVSLAVSSLCFGLPYLLICRYFAPRVWQDLLGPILCKLR
jgi:putative peptidoglycan lipid II flippase